MIFRRHRMTGVIELVLLIIPALIGLLRDGMPEDIRILWFWWVPGLLLLAMLGFAASLCNGLVSSPKGGLIDLYLNLALARPLPDLQEELWR